MPKRTRGQRNIDMIRVANMYVEGKTLFEISSVIKVSMVQIHEDLKLIREEWKIKYAADFDDIINEQLAKLDKIEMEAWSSWYESKNVRKRITEKQSAPVEVAEGSGVEMSGELLERIVVEEQSPGDPRYLQVVGGCIERRCKIIGIDEGAKQLPGGRGKLGAKYTDDERLAAIQALVDSKGTGTN